MHREAILNSLTKKQGNIFRLSKQKYASNVVEKLMMYGTTEQKNLILKEILTVRSSRDNYTNALLYSNLFFLCRFMKEQGLVPPYSSLKIP